MKNAWIFPGQASQKIGMGKDLFENTKIGKKYYEIANDLLDSDIQSVSFNGPEELLKKTRNEKGCVSSSSILFRIEINAIDL